eukprot:gnl/MRDRNA2_/MRDRNA2_65142_c0_seq3.p1 gnl/MRDRNA2_/MRDRNA2_65142_c0~~gnl/MRDRNA2_/MRDRNA2_65142_c0_seq3.p1  ORF type:complete len:115 (+),score=30.40 gnl/MRDRNA2_/MRDRNA2_65142_c0_seq3:133-477(+)
MATHPDATLNNFPRDMQWGQGLQLIEDLAADPTAPGPVPFVVEEGELLELITRFSVDGRSLQFELTRVQKEEIPAIEVETEFMENGIRKLEISQERMDRRNQEEEGEDFEEEGL